MKKLPDKASESENQKILEIEGQQFYQKLVTVISLLLMARRKTFSSGKIWRELEEASIKEDFLLFVYCWSLGLAQDVKRANLSVSFGHLTLPHS